MGTLNVKADPTFEPLSLPEVKAHLRVDYTDEDALIQRLIRTARRHLEWSYGRAMVTQSLVLTLDSFDPADWTAESFYGLQPLTWQLGLGVSWSMIPLRSPVQSITSVKYIDPAGNQQTFTDYAFAAGSEAALGRIFPKINKVWPVAGLTPAGITIEWVAGFTSADLVPDDWKSAMLLLIGALFENREEETLDVRAASARLKLGLDALMTPYAPPLLR